MNDTTVYFTREKDGTYSLAVPKYWPGTTFYGFTEVFVKRMLGDRPLGESNRRRVPYMRMYAVKRLAEQWYDVSRVIDPDRFYIITKTINGWRAQPWWPSFATEEEAKKFFAAEKMQDWLHTIDTGKSVLKYSWKYYSAAESDQKKAEILKALLEVED
jgi:hypothetical protein